MLGYRNLGVNQTTLVYSRDALSGPLRALCALLHQVRSGQFDPDNTRSGRWTEPALETKAPDGPDGTQASASSGCDRPSDSDSDTSSSCASSASSQEEQVLLGTSHLLSLIASSREFSLSMNTRSGVLHVFRSGADRFLCGRSCMSLHCKEVFESQDSRLCQVCSHVTEGVLDGKWAKPR